MNRPSFLAKTEELFDAIKKHKYSYAEQLLKEGANPNRLLLNGVTPLHLAVAAESTSSIEYVKLLLDYKGNPNVCDADGITPFHIAAQWGKADCLVLFLQNGADISLTDKEGRDIHWFAQESNHCRTIIDEYIAAKNECIDDTKGCDLLASYAQITSPIRTVNAEEVYPLHEIDCNQLQLCNRRKVRKSFAAQSSSISIKNVDNCKPNNLRSQQKAKPIVEEKTTKFVLDATSPDHCFYVLKPTTQHYSEDHTKLHDTLLLPVVSTKMVEESSFQSSPDLENKACDCVEAETAANSSIQQSDSEDDSNSFYNCNENKLSCDEKSLSDSVSCSFLSNFGDVFGRDKQQLPDAVCTSAVSCEPDDELCKQMLLASRSAFTATDKDYSAVRTISYETVSAQESFCTFADSTLPLEYSELDVKCRKQASNNIACDETLTEQFSQLATEHSHANTRCLTGLPDTTESLNRKSNASMSAVFEGTLKCNEPNTSRCEQSNIQNATAPERELKLYLSGASEDDLESSLPIKLSVSCHEESDNTIIYNWQSLPDISSYEDWNGPIGGTIAISARIQSMNDKQLRTELLKRGVNPGPIAYGRKQYEKQLYALEQGKTTVSISGPSFSSELNSVLRGIPLPQSVVTDDHSLRKEFDDPSYSTRGGSAKDSFNYLLLDPRVTKNLPERAKTMSEAEALKVFAGATFYVGKGKKSRPYAHLKEALSNSNKSSTTKKIQHIVDIWQTDGVVSLHIFQNVLACEAFTREAAMIDAFGLDHLTNHVRGKCYGSAHLWKPSRLRQYGSFLIVRAMQILLLEGERHIRPHQISNRNQKSKLNLRF